MVHRKLTWLTGAAIMLAAWLFVGTDCAQADEIPEEYRKTVENGLKYLAGDGTDKNPGQQFKDGHWAANGNIYPVAMTGLAGIALLMEGSTVREGKYSKSIRKAADWLMSKSQRQGNRPGLIFVAGAGADGRYMFGHSYATLFLACCYGDEDNREKREKLKDVLTRAVKFIHDAQSTQGGWFYTSAKDGHDTDEGCATICQLQALRACRNAGIPVPKECINKGNEYLRKSTTTEGGIAYSLSRQVGVQQVGGRPPLTAGALACIFRRGEFNDEHVQKWFKFCKQRKMDVGGDGAIRYGHDGYTHNYFAQAVYQLGDDGWEKMFGPTAEADRITWTNYRKTLFSHLKRTQKADGSWGGDGFSVGSVYITALYCTIMQLDRNVVPFYMRDKR